METTLGFALARDHFPTTTSAAPKWILRTAGMVVAVLVVTIAAALLMPWSPVHSDKRI